MTETAVRPAETAPGARVLCRADGVELLGEAHGSGYRAGTALVRRRNGSLVQVGPILHALLDCLDRPRPADEAARALTDRLQRRVTTEQVLQLAEKLAAQGLLAGTEDAAPPTPNPLLALRWKLLVSNPTWTRRLSAPFALLFWPFLLWPVVAAFAVTAGYLLFHHGFAAATAQAFHTPAWLLLVFALGVLSAGFHELGHAAACRYGGATPRGIGVGIYLVWPCFYTDVTDAYRLPRRDRLRVDFGGLYFNAVVAVATMGAWLAVRREALLLLVAFQLLQMVRQLSPVIRADGYHILADLTGVPDLYAHLGPTLKRLLPGRRHRATPSPLRGRTRVIVTVWVLVMLPILAALLLGAVLVLPRLLMSAWVSGRLIVRELPHQSGLGIGASLLQLLALVLPAVGTVLMAQRTVRSFGRRAREWSRGRVGRQAVVAAATVGLMSGLAYAWWPSGQYRPVRPSDRGTLGSLVGALASPAPAATPPVTFHGKLLGYAMVPRGGATPAHPALLVVPGGAGHPPVVVVLQATRSGGPSTGVSLPFQLPADTPKPGDTEALAVNGTDGGVVYDVSYALIEVTGGAPVTNHNSAYAIASCVACRTVAVSFQVVLVIGQSDVVAPVNAAAAVNYKCPACVTTALAQQLVVTLSKHPSAKLLRQLKAALRKLDRIAAHAADLTAAQVVAQVDAVEREIKRDLRRSGLLAQPLPSDSPTPAPGAASVAPTDTPSPSATAISTTSPSSSATPTASTSASPTPSSSASP